MAKLQVSPGRTGCGITLLACSSLPLSSIFVRLSTGLGDHCRTSKFRLSPRLFVDWQQTLSHTLGSPSRFYSHSSVSCLEQTGTHTT